MDEGFESLLNSWHSDYRIWIWWYSHTMSTVEVLTTRKISASLYYNSKVSSICKYLAQWACSKSLIASSHLEQLEFGYAYTILFEICTPKCNLFSRFFIPFWFDRKARLFDTHKKTNKKSCYNSSRNAWKFEAIFNFSWKHHMRLCRSQESKNHSSKYLKKRLKIKNSSLGFKVRISIQTI